MMKGRVICILVTILVGAAVFSGLLYAIIAKVDFEPLEAHINACNTTDYVCGNHICTLFSLNVSFNRTIEGRVIPYNNYIFNYYFDNAPACPQGRIIVLHGLIYFNWDKYCIEQYDSTCPDNTRFKVGAAMAGLVLSIGVGCGITFLVKHFRNRLRYEREVEMVPMEA